MDNTLLYTERIAQFGRSLYQQERCAGTIEKYVRDVNAFALWLDGEAVTKEAAVAWKEHLLGKGYNPATINSMLAAVNQFFRFCGWEDCRVKPLRLQKRLFRGKERELSRQEYQRLVETAQRLGQERLGLLLETICATGLRVSEVRYITVEAAQQGRAEISLKGKIRTILIPSKLRKKLLQFARRRKQASGEIFVTRSGRPLDRRQIWAEMKALGKRAGVALSKVHPHSLRHLFARTFYRACQDVAKLADVLGHSSIETTRIYLISTGTEHLRQMDRLGLVT